MDSKLAPAGRHRYVHEGRTVYEWDQTFAEVNLYVAVPPKTMARHLFCDISSRHLRFGLHKNTPYLDVSNQLGAQRLMASCPPLLKAPLFKAFALPVQMDLAGEVKTSECFWTLGESTCISCSQLFSAQAPPSRGNLVKRS
jgi:hypothetical protein